MTSLAEAYEGSVGRAAGPRRLTAGVGLFLVGVALLVGGMALGTTDLLSVLGLDRTAAYRRAGVLGGLGVVATVGGVFIVLPSGRTVDAAATIGTSVSVLGVAMFWYAYPSHWAGFGRELTLPVVAVYSFGTLTAVWCLLVGIANFKRRNDPGGTVALEVEAGERTRVVEVEPEEVDRGRYETGLGAVGTFGPTPDGEVETQTNATGAGAGGARAGGHGAANAGGHGTADAGGGGPAAAGDGPDPMDEAGGVTGYESAPGADAGPPTAEAPPGAEPTAGRASDGGDGARDIRPVGDGRVVTPSESARELADRYCGNCEHFRYVRGENGMRPYCGLHEQPMDDMEACEQWEPNT